MNALSFANRLVRDLRAKSLTELTADARQELQDAINGSLQRLHDLAPDHSKEGVVSLTLDAPLAVSLTVTDGSREISGHTFPENHFYRSIRISGDDVDNQVSGETSLTHPYSGTGGTVDATVYCDAITIPEEFAEIVSDPLILETGTHLSHVRRNPWDVRGMKKHITRPVCYWMEPNGRNRNPPVGPVVMRLGSYPERAYRMRADAVMSPARITFSDLLTGHASLPIREEHVEAYLLPIARAALTESALWENGETISRVRDKGADAEARYAILIPQYPATPTHRVRTRRGY